MKHADTDEMAGMPIQMIEPIRPAWRDALHIIGKALAAPIIVIVLVFGVGMVLGMILAIDLMGGLCEHQIN